MADLAENRPSVVDVMHACERNSSAKEDSSHNMRLLPVGYKPGEHDVLCGRGRKCFNHAGNVKFRAIVQSFLPQYSKAMAKLEKSYILSDVVEQVRKNSGEGGFIKKDPDTSRWYEVGDFLAREKTSQAFRDVLHDKYKSSNTAKKKRRQEEQAEKFVRAHSNRSLGASSVDASSVHSVGSSTTGDYMLSDSKLMRIKRSDSILNLGETEDEQQHDDLLGGLGQDIANYGRPSTVNRQRSLRSVLDFDTNRRAVMTNTGSSSSFYNRSSCPNLLAPPQQPQLPHNVSAQQMNHNGATHQQHNFNGNGNGNAPPITQIEIIQEEGMGAKNNMMFPDSLESSQLHDFDSFETSNPTPGEGSVASNSSSNAGPITPTAQPKWFHHSQPNLFGDAPPVNSQAGQRRAFARQPPNLMVRRPHRTSSGSSGSGGLSGVQQQIGNLGLNDNNHGQSFDSQGGGGGGPQRVVGGPGSGGPGSGGAGPTGPRPIPIPSADGGHEDNEELERHYLPYGLQHQHHTAQQLLLNQNNTQPPLPSSSHPGDQRNFPPAVVSTQIPNNNNNNSNIQVADNDADLLARLQTLQTNGFGMDVIDENPYEPVPLPEG